METDKHSGVQDNGTALTSSKFFADAYIASSAGNAADTNAGVKDCSGKDCFGKATNLAFEPDNGHTPKLDFAAAKPLQMNGPDIGGSFKKADKLLPQRAGSSKKSESYLPDMSDALAALNVYF